MEENLHIWNAIKRPPAEALKKIKGGRLSGMTDISPQWRYHALTEKFGPCGIGWKVEILELWSSEGNDGVQVANAKVALYVKEAEEWSDPIPGVGGSMLVAKETKGLYTSDESYKMAVTDAIGTAAKLLGLAADIYAGMWDGSKYKDSTNPPPAPPPKANPRKKMFDALTAEGLTKEEMVSLADFIKGVYNEENLSDDTMLEIAKKPNAFVNEWREAQMNAEADEVPF